jgi:hypothetical protein
MTTNNTSKQVSKQAGKEGSNHDVFIVRVVSKREKSMRPPLLLLTKTAGSKHADKQIQQQALARTSIEHYYKSVVIYPSSTPQTVFT